MIRFSGGATLKFDRRGTVVTFLAALGLTIHALVGSFASGVPRNCYSVPALIAIPALILSEWHLEYSPVILAYFFGYAILVVMIFPLNANGAWSK
jgi:hypothetical protein